MRAAPPRTNWADRGPTPPRTKCPHAYAGKHATPNREGPDTEKCGSSRTAAASWIWARCGGALLPAFLPVFARRRPDTDVPAAGPALGRHSVDQTGRLPRALRDHPPYWDEQSPGVWDARAFMDELVPHAKAGSGGSRRA